MIVLDEISAAPLPQSLGPVLATERLVLRAPRRDDVPAIAALANDLRVAAMTARVPHPYGEADAEEFISKVAGVSDTSFAVTLADATLIGLCGIGRLHGGAPELGYWFGVVYWGQGYATEAARAVIDHAFNDPAFDALESGARVSNPASRRVLEKCGFQWTGVALQRVRALSSSVPVDRFRLERSVWSSAKNRHQAKRVA